jgi:hypothetical protein
MRTKKRLRKNRSLRPFRGGAFVTTNAPVKKLDERIRTANHKKGGADQSTKKHLFTNSVP